MDKNDSFDGPLQEGRHTTLRSFSWGNREFTISSDKISLYVGGIPYDTKPMLVISRHLRVYPDGALNSMNGFSQPGRRVGCPRSKEIHLAGESFPGSTPDPRRISSIGFVS